MENMGWNKHYAAFKWAVSTNWKDKNTMHRSIQSKIETLVQEYNLTEREILDTLWILAFAGITGTGG
jgi:hypothetical protein